MSIETVIGRHTKKNNTNFPNNISGELAKPEYLPNIKELVLETLS